MIVETQSWQCNWAQSTCPSRYSGLLVVRQAMQQAPGCAGHIPASRQRQFSKWKPAACYVACRPTEVGRGMGAWLFRCIHTHASLHNITDLFTTCRHLHTHAHDAHASRHLLLYYQREYKSSTPSATMHTHMPAASVSCTVITR